MQLSSISLAITRLGAMPWTPATLFAASEVGVWYDPSDLSSMFQLSNGTTAAVIEGPVGYIADKSGNGKHATQATAASRPTLSARVNLLTKTEDLMNAIWSASAGATKVSATTFSSNAQFGQCRYAWSGLAAGASYLFSVEVAAVSGNTALHIVQEGASITRTAITVTSTPQRFSITGVADAGGFLNLGVQDRNAAGFGVIYMSKAQAVPADQASLAYQRVDTASVYDTVGFPTYLKFDGVDDSLATGSIDFSAGDQMTVFAGVRKLSDAALGMLAELSNDVNSNNGSFWLLAPTNATYKFSFLSRGTVNADASTTSASYAAPSTVVLLGISAISTDTSILRLNGTQVASIATDQGTGNYGNYPLYIGRRGGSSLPFNGHLYSLIVRAAQSTDAQITSAETFVAGKTGVTL